MVGFLIFAVSLGAFVQFLLSYVRSLLMACANVPLSEQTERLVQLPAEEISGGDFPRLVRLLESTCGNFVNWQELKAVRMYHSALSALKAVIPPLARWAERERRACAYFAAVALDCRLTRHNAR
jgi:hypothetical protein